ncbi:chemotaxis protein [Jeotgalibacillus soli]|nr:chemotaxis protein [Jeotgalibacillus soli]
MHEHKGILLESGTNELEIVEFEINGSFYGINVIKVKEIIQPIPVTVIPHSHSNVEGIIHLRGEVLPVVDIRKVLGAPIKNESFQEKYIVAEFNKLKVVFHVDNVSQIHRISWEQIEKPSELYQGGDSPVVGVVKRENNMLLLLDFERIILEISPDSGINVGRLKKLGQRERSSKKLMVAEDSPLLRKLLLDTLTEAGFEQVEFFENGFDAYAYLENIVQSNRSEKIGEHVHLLITDIEMPKMDGHHLTRKVKEHAQLNSLPIIIFSSLITDDLKHKGEKVGADDQISKPEIAELVQSIDRLAL